MTRILYVPMIVASLALWACGSSDDSTGQTPDGGASTSGGAGSTSGAGGSAAGAGGATSGSGGTTSGGGGAPSCPAGQMLCFSGCSGVGHCAAECAITNVFCPPIVEGGVDITDAQVGSASDAARD